MRTAVDVVDGRVPVYAGAGGSIAQAKDFARAAAEAGADGLLLLPPYLVEMPEAGLIAYTREVSDVTDLPVIVYNRNNARYTEASAVEVAQLPKVVGFKDGTGDLDQVARIVRAVTDALAPTGKPFQFFNGMPTAEVSQQAYRAIGVPLYSSATFAIAPELALAFYQSLETGNERLTAALLREYFHPLVRLRDKVPGYPVSLIKAGVTLEGLDVGPVRPPLILPTPRGPRGTPRDHRRRPRGTRRGARRRSGALMAGNRIRITGARITPIAFADPPLLNTVGVHQPFALRAIIQLDTDAGLVGLGETYADTAHLERLTAATDAIVGQDVFALNTIRSLISDRLGGDQGAVVPARRHDHVVEHRRPGVLTVRGGLPRRAGACRRSAGVGPARRRGARRRAVQRVPVLQVGRPSRR